MGYYQPKNIRCPAGRVVIPTRDTWGKITSHREVNDIYKKRREFLEKAKTNALEKKDRGGVFVKELAEMDIDKIMEEHEKMQH